MVSAAPVAPSRKGVEVMTIVKSPWSGLAALAPRVDLWPVLRRAGVVRGSPGAHAVPGPAHAEPLGVDLLRAAGLPARDAMAVVCARPWSLRAGAGVLRAGDD